MQFSFVVLFLPKNLEILIRVSKDASAIVGDSDCRAADAGSHEVYRTLTHGCAPRNPLYVCRIRPGHTPHSAQVRSADSENSPGSFSPDCFFTPLPVGISFSACAPCRLQPFRSMPPPNCRRPASTPAHAPTAPTRSAPAISVANASRDAPSISPVNPASCVACRGLTATTKKNRTRTPRS